MPQALANFGIGTPVFRSYRCAGRKPLLGDRVPAQPQRFAHFSPMTPTDDNATEDLWVFGYGSLMWRPGFDYLERLEARLIGAHRALCVYSFVHRGTPERPGLVLGLDHGGDLPRHRLPGGGGRAPRTVAYLRAREQVHHRSIARRVRAVWLKSEPERRVPALCYMVDRGHAQYAGRLTLEQQLHHVRQGHGQSGPNRDYVIATVAALEAARLSRDRAASAGGAAQGRARGARRLGGVTLTAQAKRRVDPVLGELALALGNEPRGRRLDRPAAAAQRKSSLSRPGGIGSRISTRIVPG